MLRFKIILSIIFGLLWGFSININAQKVSPDLYEKANKYASEANYKDASEIYRRIVDKEDSVYNELTSKQVNEMRNKNSVQEIELKTSQRTNVLLKLVFLISFILLLLLIPLIIYLHKKSKKLLEYENKLKHAKLLTEVSIKNKSIFLSNMSHEIKTPLNAISGFSELLTNPSLDDDTRNQCRDIIKLNSELLLKLLNDIVDISCLDINNIKMNMKKCNAVELSRNVIKTIDKIKQTPAKIVFTTGFDELQLYTDTLRLQQVLINILINATKFTKQGTITLDLALDASGNAKFSVTDTGCGIPLDKQKTIFSRFERVNEGIQGSGLGLYICHLIIEKLGGNIWIDSEYTSGTRFVFTHPIIKEEEKQI